MPVINQTEMLSDLLEYLPNENVLTNTQLETVISNVISNHIELDDEANYSEALCKALRVAGLINDGKHTVDGAGLIREQVGKVTYQYSEDHQKNLWKDFVNKSLPNICPYLPKGGYNIPRAFGIQVIRGAEVKVNSCTDSSTLIL